MGKQDNLSVKAAAAKAKGTVKKTRSHTASVVTQKTDDTDSKSTDSPLTPTALYKPLEDSAFSDVTTPSTGSTTTCNSVNSLMKNQSLSPQDTPRKTGAFSFVVKTPALELKGSNIVGSPSSFGSTKPLDSLYITVVSGSDGLSGFGLYTLPAPNKLGKAGPWSSKLMLDLVRRDHKFGGVITFERRSFELHLPDGTVPEYRSQSGMFFGGRLFACIGMDVNGLEQEHYREIADSVVKDLNDQSRNPVCHVPEDFLNMQRKTWSDIMGIDNAFQSLDFKAKPTLRKMIGLDFAQPDEKTWGKSNIEHVATYFNKGKVPKELCVQLGLPREWVLVPSVGPPTPMALSGTPPLDSDDDDSSSSKNKKSV